MAKEFTIIIEKDEDGWLVSEVVELPGCHTQSKTMDELIERTREAIKAYLGKEKIEVKEKYVPSPNIKNVIIPKIINLKFINGEYLGNKKLASFVNKFISGNNDIIF